VFLSRFIAKVAIEPLCLKLMTVQGWEEEIIDKNELDPLRHFARYGPAAFVTVRIGYVRHIVKF
jgi:hypothetical protein